MTFLKRFFDVCCFLILYQAYYFWKSCFLMKPVETYETYFFSFFASFTLMFVFMVIIYILAQKKHQQIHFYLHFSLLLRVKTYCCLLRFARGFLLSVYCTLLSTPYPLRFPRCSLQSAFFERFCYECFLSD